MNLKRIVTETAGDDYYPSEPYLFYGAAGIYYSTYISTLFLPTKKL